LMLAYSSETFLDTCLQAGYRIREEDQKSGRVTNIVVKLLTRDLEGQWRLPFLPVLEADYNYRQALHARFDSFLSRWNVEFFQAFEFLPRENIQLERRWYPFEPTYKAIIINRCIAFVGAYSIHEINHQGVQGWDYHGHGAVMYEVSSAESMPEGSASALESIVNAFDELWSGYSRPVE